MSNAIKVLALLGLMFVGASQLGAVTITVTNLNDSGAGSLRQAIIDANALAGTDTIVFGGGVTGTIQLQNGLPLVNTDMQIIGPGASNLTIRRFIGGPYQIMRVGPSSGINAATISGLRFANGNDGGLVVGACNLTLSGCVFDSNTATSPNRAGNFTHGTSSNNMTSNISDCVFINGSSTGSGTAGGVNVYGPGMVVTMTRCTIDSNTTAGSGGAGGLRCSVDGGTGSFFDCTISNNASLNGSSSSTGGVSLGSGVVAPAYTITNCTISGNTTEGDSAAGGMSVAGGAVYTCSFMNCTITNNNNLLASAPSGAGGLIRSNSVTVNLTNTLIALNAVVSVRSDLRGVFSSQGYNFIGDTTGGTIFATTGDQFGTSGSPLNPNIGPLANNGGPTQTHALLNGSTCINAGTSVGAPANDQRGQARFGATDIGAYEYVPTTPECDVTRGAANVADAGSDSPALSFAAGIATQITYRFTNAGGGTLTLTNPATIGSLNNCSVSIVSPPVGSLASLAFSDTVLSVTPTAAGAFSFSYSIDNNDADENPYNWTINGTATGPQPELDAFRGATAIASGGNDGLGTNFAPGFASNVTYTLSNTGTASLSITNPAAITAMINCGVTISTQPATSVAQGTATTTVLSITPGAIGNFSFIWSLTNTDPNENPYVINVSGVAAPPAAEMDASRGATAVADGGNDPLSGTFTAGAQFPLTYTIANNGTGALNITNPASITNLINCTVNIATTPAGSVSTGNSTTTQLDVTPAGAGAFSFTYSIVNNDGDENPYNFNVGGTAIVVTAPEIDLQRPATFSISSGGTDSVGSLGVGVNVDLDYTVANTGNATLNLTGSPRVSITSSSNCSASITIQPPATVGAASTTTFRLTVNAASAAAVLVTISIANDDSNENPYIVNVLGTGVTAQPEIDLRNPTSQSVASGSSDSIGGISVGVPNTRSYTIHNLGNAALVLSGSPAVQVSSPSNCSASIQTQPALTSIPGGQNTSFSLQFTVTATGAFSFLVSITNNDSDENPYTFTVSGNGTVPAAPEIDVQRPAATPIANGGTDTISGAISGQASALVYTVENQGSALLNLPGATPVSISGSSNCSATVTVQPPATVATSSAVTFTVTVTPGATGAFSFTVSVANDDSNENPYVINASGSAAAPPPAEIDVQRPAGTSRASGSADALGTLAVGTPTPVIYTVENQGGAALTLGTVTLSGQTNCSATVSANPASPVAGGTTTTFTITVTVSSSAAFSFTISMVNSDSNENPYVINVSGTGGAGTPEIDLQRPIGTSIPSGGIDNLGNVAVTTTQMLTFTVANIGTDNLSVSAANILTQNNCAASVTASPVGTVPPLTGTASCVVTFSVTAAGPFDFTLRISNNDSNEALYNITVQGTGIFAPEINIQRGPTVPSGGADNISGGQAGSAVVLTYTVSNVGSSTLTLGPSPIVNFLAPSNCSVSVTQPLTSVLAPGNSTTFDVTITPVSAGGFSVQINVINDDADESPYSFLINGTASAGGGGGDEGGDDEGCTTSETGGLAPFVAVLLSLVALRLRRRIISARR